MEEASGPMPSPCCTLSPMQCCLHGTNSCPPWAHSSGIKTVFAVIRGRREGPVEQTLGRALLMECSANLQGIVNSFYACIPSEHFKCFLKRLGWSVKEVIIIQPLTFPGCFCLPSCKATSDILGKLLTAFKTTQQEGDSDILFSAPQKIQISSYALNMSGSYWW